jgi:ribosomal protein S18 acetylase RimI-like enzyme
MKVDFRPARPEDVDSAAAWIWDTEGELADAMFGLGDHPRALRSLAYFYQRPGTLYSREIVEIAQAQGEAVGLLIGYPPQEEHRRVRGMARAFFSFYGLWDTLRVIRRGLAGYDLHDGDPGDWVIANVAVSPAARGRGVGQQIMLHAEERARLAGCRRTTLLVRYGNPARNLYDRLGYRPLAEYSSERLLRVLKSPGFTWMGKELE